MKASRSIETDKILGGFKLGVKEEHNNAVGEREGEEREDKRVSKCVCVRESGREGDKGTEGNRCGRESERWSNPCKMLKLFLVQQS